MASDQHSAAVFPTHVGVFLYMVGTKKARKSLPHARGDLSHSKEFCDLNECGSKSFLILSFSCQIFQLKSSGKAVMLFRDYENDKQ